LMSCDGLSKSRGLPRAYDKVRSTYCVKSARCWPKSQTASRRSCSKWIGNVWI
jgi:hypothetical protein